MEITFLGTSFMIPTKRRNHTAILVTEEGENVLIDCGEGTQRQFKLADKNPCKLTKILITHWHGDHVLGIPGLIQTLNLNSYSKTLQIYGPRGTKRRMEALQELFLHGYDIKMEVHEIDEGSVIEDGPIRIEAFRASHGVPCLAYSIEQRTKTKMDVSKLKKLGIKGPLIGELQRGKDIIWEGKKVKSRDITHEQKGKKAAFILDTGMAENLSKVAKDADVLICEAQYLDEDREKGEEYLHLTASQAGEIAKKANAKALYLTHISQRYEMCEPKLIKEAKKKFSKVILAEDLMRIEL